jgi:capsular polysaccharide biosynthesis protein
MTPRGTTTKTGDLMSDRRRAGDADRDRAARLLGVHFAAGRLTQDEFADRLAAALAAATFTDLREILADLPGGPTMIRPQSSALERRYRRLLALYPARYRRAHQDEILAILLTGAPQGKIRPSLREAADLLGACLRVWCQSLTRSGWRGVLALVAAGTVTGFLGGITVAAASSHPVTSTTSVFIGMRSGPGQRPLTTAGVHAELNHQMLIMRSPQVLSRAAQVVRPAVSEQTLSREVHVTPVTDQVVQISVQAPTDAQALIAARAVAASYVSYANQADRVVRVLDPAFTVPAPSFASTVADSSGLGALCGTVLGASLALAASRPRRRFRIT